MSGSSGEPAFDVVVIAYRSRPTLDSFLTALGTEVPVTVVDNSFNEDDLSGLLAGYPNARHLDSGGNLGFSAAANIGAAACSSPYIVFMNPDTLPNPDAVTALVSFLDANPDVASCGAAGIDSAGGGAQPSFRRLVVHALGLHRLRPLSGIFFYPDGDQIVDVEWVSGSCAAVRRDAFEAVGAWDPAYYIYMSDFDLGLRMQRAGHRQVVRGDVVIPHADGGSSDVPATWTWERRGSAWVRFLRATRGRFATGALLIVLAAGYAARVVLYTLTRQRMRRQEVATYLRAVIRTWLGRERTTAAGADR